MAAAIDDVEGRHRHHELIHGLTRQLRDVLVQWHLASGGSSAAHCHRHSEDRVRSKLRLRPTPLVLGAIELLDHFLVDLGLLGDVHADEFRCDEVVHIGDRLQDTLAEETILVAVAQLQRLVNASRGTAGHGRAEECRLCAKVHLHGGVATRVEDLAGANRHDDGTASVSDTARRIIERGDARQDLPLQQFQGSTAPRAAVRHLVLSVVLLACRGGVAAADDSDSSALGDLDDLVHHRLRAHLECLHLENAHGTVPDDGL
mmetsp:Transcript_74644/g.165065  ORF Transcript_74644/g.165065 Transcript_74644/m.165065 type:complete len:260 (-) Transcript_74644:1075-1854(-)